MQRGVAAGEVERRAQEGGAVPSRASAGDTVKGGMGGEGSCEGRDPSGAKPLQWALLPNPRGREVPWGGGDTGGERGPWPQGPAHAGGDWGHHGQGGFCCREHPTSFALLRDCPHLQNGSDGPQA